MRRVIWVAACFVLMGLGWFCTPQSVWADDPGPFCRFGVNINTIHAGAVSEISSYNTAPLGIGWYINYHADATPSHPNGIEYTPMVRLSQEFDEASNTYSYSYSPKGEALQAVIDANPAADWFIGNEPDRLFYQDSMAPEMYAAAYHELYHLIKAADPKARIFWLHRAARDSAAICRPDPAKLSDQFGAKMPVDGWSIHNFILNEQSCAHFGSGCWGADIPPGIDALSGLIIGLNELEKHRDIELFKQQVQRFRVWMAERGYTGLPVYLSEYGVLLPDWYTKPNPDDPANPIRLFPPDKVNEFMNSTFDYMLNAADPQLGDPNDDFRLIQRFSWYSVNEKTDSLPGFQYNGYLFDPTTFERSLMGDNYANYVSALAETVDLYPVSLNVLPALTAASANASTEIAAILRARIANSGNTLAAQSATVRFYEGDPAQGGRQIGADHAITLSGCGDSVSIEMTWNNVATDSHEIFVTVTPGDGIVETNGANNARSQTFTPPKALNYLPIVKK
ncbi:MAG: CARDB domain-containing protein [Caldilineaceae bacterium]